MGNCGRLLVRDRGLEVANRPLHVLAVRRVLRLPQIAAIEVDRLLFLSERSMALRDVEEERRILVVSVRFFESFERLPIFAEIVVLARLSIGLPRARFVLGVRRRRQGNGDGDDDHRAHGQGHRWRSEGVVHASPRKAVKTTHLIGAAMTTLA